MDSGEILSIQRRRIVLERIIINIFVITIEH